MTVEKRFASHWILATLLAGLTVALPALSPEQGRSARDKIERINSESLQAGEVLTLTEDELNSYFRYDLAAEMPAGVRNLRGQIFEDTGVAEASVDLAKLRTDSLGAGGRFWLALFSGERELKAAFRYVSADGNATVEIQSAEIDGTSIPAPILEWLVESFVSPQVEGFRLGEPYPLPAQLRQIRLEPGQAVIVAK